MFRNAGVKLKVLAKVMFFVLWGGIAIVLPVIAEEGALLLLTVPLGFLIGWLSTLLTYAFGELCQNVYEINEMMRRNSSGPRADNTVPSAPLSAPAPTDNDMLHRNSSGPQASYSVTSAPLSPSPSTDNDTVKCPNCGRSMLVNSKYCVNCRAITR